MSTITRAPLTYAQQLVLGRERVTPGSVLGPRFIVRAAYTVRHVIDPDALQAAVDDVVARHDALRTVIAGGPDEPHLRVLPPMPGRLITQDISDVDAFLAEVSDADYPAGEPPLLWVRLGRCADGSRRCHSWS